ncbi:hypothetical protein HBH56_157750 [Parastagonospora nodorum]|uniref:N-acetyltransferase domain-containing protein n=1 Tax=Phaeosphaeria nodorum (strain SN15 / ATCC MYA-4574 / FGSC 10173) TaxID=321614 RepID=A0A7U2F2F0_PHANO|nr:hypothetical protein HBH56_157750 [Parastagonospora nodorum]QRC97433.1 hypothetical protein JI435_087800 [Parastagonospora nodorum SN15]KAH3922912.1 hypothetical protein HBH54_216990 [Parastagonospora nodorum]KAH3973471.1 hypothetical protein HBH51_097360 [Parastagonospora nodorum]KAH4002341.1 hypothetical protein HBI10_073700 [Parastagonospora nodorum]
MTNFEIQHCTEEDIPRVFELVSLSFGHDHEYMDAIFPHHDTPAGRKAGSERLLKSFHEDQHGVFLKLVETKSEKIVAAAKWNIYNGGPVPQQPELDGDYWQTEDDKEFAKGMFKEFFTARQRLIEETEAHLAALDMLMVDPAYQRMGAGRALVRWGLAEADKLGIEAVVEGSDQAQRLYESEGFDGTRLVCPVPEKFAARRKQAYWWMRRPLRHTA